MTGSYLIKGATVVSVDPAIGVVNNCDILIKEGLIAAVGPGIAALPDSTIIDGSITPGKRADLPITRCDSTRLTPVHDPVAALVLYANGSDIDSVFVDGKLLKSGGRLVGVDWPKVRGELRDSSRAIMERSTKAPRERIEKAALTVMRAFAGEGEPKIKLG